MISLFFMISGESRPQGEPVWKLEGRSERGHLCGWCEAGAHTSVRQGLLRFTHTTAGELGHLAGVEQQLAPRPSCICLISSSRFWASWVKCTCCSEVNGAGLSVTHGSMIESSERQMWVPSRPRDSMFSLWAPVFPCAAPVYTHLPVCQLCWSQAKH